MKLLILFVVAFTSTHAAKLFSKEDQQVLLSSTSNIQSHVQSSSGVVPSIPVAAAPIVQAEQISQSVIPSTISGSSIQSSVISQEASPQLYWPSRLIGAPISAPIAAPIATQLYTAVKPVTTVVEKIPLVSTVNVQSSPLVYQQIPTIQSGVPYIYSPYVQYGYDPLYQILRK